MTGGPCCLVITKIDSLTMSKHNLSSDEEQGPPSQKLNRLNPSVVLDMYLSERESDLAENTRQSHRYVLEQFVDWCAENSIATIADIDGRDLHDFRMERRDEVGGNTLRAQLGVLRQYVRFAESIEAASVGLGEKIIMPQVERQSRDEHLEEEMANVVLEHLHKFQYASRDHGLLKLLWVTAIRVGTARSFDVDDFDREERTIAVRHRPETDTPLKHGVRAELLIALDTETSTVLADYIDNTHPNVTDEHGRTSLFATDRGRAGRSTLPRAVYRWTRPCQRNEDCPHDRDPDECEAKRTVQKASQCPSTSSPHQIRRGSIPYLLEQKTPVKALSDSADVSEGVLDKHYDARTEKERTETRREFFE